MKLSPIERACRELCREYDVPEEHWRAYENTVSAAARALHIATADLTAAMREHAPPLTWACQVLALLLAIELAVSVLQATGAIK
jgi:hypothetical protein